LKSINVVKMIPLKLHVQVRSGLETGNIPKELNLVNKGWSQGTSTYAYLLKYKSIFLVIWVFLFNNYYHLAREKTDLSTELA